MKSKITFYIVRHGKTVYNTEERVQGWCDSPLTDEGIEVAQHLGRGLRDIKFDSVYVSDLNRTHQTAQVLLQSHGQRDLDLTVMPGIKESCFGRFEEGLNATLWSEAATYLGYETPEDLSADVLAKKIGNREVLGAVKEIDTEGLAEDFYDVEKRTHEALKSIVEKEKGEHAKNVLIISHGMAIRVMLDAFGGEQELKNYLENASVSKLVYLSGDFELKSIGDMTYVENGKKMV